MLRHTWELTGQLYFSFSGYYSHAQVQLHEEKTFRGFIQIAFALDIMHRRPQDGKKKTRQQSRDALALVNYRCHVTSTRSSSMFHVFWKRVFESVKLTNCTSQALNETLFRNKFLVLDITVPRTCSMLLHENWLLELKRLHDFPGLRAKFPPLKRMFSLLANASIHFSSLFSRCLPVTTFIVVLFRDLFFGIVQFNGKVVAQISFSMQRRQLNSKLDNFLRGTRASAKYFDVN